MTIHLTITAKGQLTLRQAVLEHLGLKPGHKVGVSLLPDGRVELQAAATAPGMQQLRGSLQRKHQQPVSLQDMQAAIERGK